MRDDDNAGRIVTLISKRSEYSCDRCFKEFSSYWHLRRVQTNEPPIEVHKVHEYTVFYEDPNKPDEHVTETKRYYKKREQDVCSKCCKPTDTTIWGMTREQRRQARVS